jgi:hypothetical protein
MDWKVVLSRLIFFIFCASMIYFYYQGLVDPIGTHYWLVSFGLAILLLDFCTLFVVALFLRMQDTPKGKRFWLFWLAMVIIIAFGASVYLNILLFGYFLVSIGIRFLLTRRRQSADQMSGDTRWIFITGVAIVLSVTVAVAFSSALLSMYPSQIELLRQYIQHHTSPGGMSGMIPDNPGFIAVWGIFYFLFQILFTVVSDRLRTVMKNATVL